MPNITQAQIATIVAALVAVIGVISQAPDRLQIPLLAVIGALGVAWIVSDAFLRGKRNEQMGARHNLAAAELHAAVLDHVDLPDPPTRKA